MPSENIVDILQKKLNIDYTTAKDILDDLIDRGLFGDLIKNIDYIKDLKALYKRYYEF